MVVSNASREVKVEYPRPEAGKAYAGLYTMQISIVAVPSESQASFEMSAPGQVPFSKEVTLGAAPKAFWVAVNTHLLPNGKNRLSVRLSSSDGNELHRSDFEIEVRNDGALAKQVAEALKAKPAPLVFEGCVDSASFPKMKLELAPWYERPDALQVIDQRQKSGELSEADANDLRHLVKNGYVRLATKIEPEAIAAANAAVDEAIKNKYQNYQYGTSQRIEHLHDHYPAIRHLWRHPEVLRFLRLVFGVPALPCQTLTYVFGSQQDLHQDTIHLTSFPAGYMCGVWIALQDIQPDSGELMVVPGSHRLERVYRDGVDCGVVKDGNWKEFGEKVVPKWNRMYQESGLKVEHYRPESGSILIWLDSLLHGGSIRKDPSLARRSVVSHYFATGSLAYYDSTGLPGYIHL